MGVASSAIVEVGRCFSVPVKDGVLYLLNYQKNNEKLKARIKDLKARRDTIESWVREGQNMRSEMPTPVVKRWLEEVNEAVPNKKKIKNKNQKEEKEEGFFDDDDDDDDDDDERLCGWCPNWCIRYRRSREAAEMVDLVEKIYRKGEHFTRSTVTIDRPLPAVEPILDDSVSFASTESILNQIMQTLEGDQRNIIGVYGMGGIGKTTLMKRLNNKLEQTGLFGKVIMVTVSKSPDTRIIQNRIAERLPFTLTDENPEMRASKLSKRLENEKSVLIILEDVWSRFELKEVGVPHPSEHEGCKIILTTRSRDVCRQMGAQLAIELKVLSEADSWALFKSKAGDVVDSDVIKPIAKQVAESCKGLPLAIVTIASTLRMEENEIMWNYALRALRIGSPIELEGVIPEVITSIKFSYDHLQDERIKPFFLLCCIFPEDRSIHLPTLICYGMGEGCFKGVRSYQDKREKGLVFIKTLKASSLLLEGSDPQFVLMHDIVRGVAIWIASKENGFLVRSGQNAFDEWPEEEELGRCRRMALINSKIRTLPNNPKCPQLRILVFQRNPLLKMIPHLFFENMKALVVLDLCETEIQQLPASISCLKCLRTLFLTHCHRLEDISAIGGLAKLETIGLKGTKIKELPKQISWLANLMHLDLTAAAWSSTCSLDAVPSNLISSLSRLEELYMRGRFRNWGIGNVEDGRNAHFSEVVSLPCLAALEVTVATSDWCYDDKCASLINLTRFVICIGCQQLGCTRHVDLVSINISCISEWAKRLLGKTEDLRIHSCSGFTNILQLNAGDLNNLRVLHVTGNDEMEHLVTASEMPPENALLTQLKELYLSQVKSMKSIWKGDIPVGSFQNVETLRIFDCDCMTYLLSPALAEALQNLWRLEIFRCEGMKKLISDEEETLVLVGDRALPPELPSSFTFCNLKVLDIRGCNSLKHIFSLQMVGNLTHLVQIRVKECLEMEELISIHQEDAEVDKNLLPMLKSLELYNLPGLTSICKRKVAFDWPSLECIWFRGCPQLKWLHIGLQSAPNLKVVDAERDWFEGLEWEDQSIKSRLYALCRV